MVKPRVDSPTNQAAIALCRDAVSRALLLSAACGTLACHGTRSAPVTDAKREAPTQPAPAAQPVVTTPPPEVTPLDLPLLRSDPRSVHSADKFAAIPCALPALSDADYEALNAQGDEVRAKSDRDRHAKELDFRGRNMTLSEDVDYLEFKRVMLSSGIRHTDNSLPIASLQLAQTGKPCSQASDVAHCSQQLDQARRALFAELECSDDGACPEFDFTYALTTRGDTIRSYRTPEELLTILGAIDTPHEAWAWLNVHKLADNIPCDMPDYAQHRKTAAGTELLARTVVSRCQPFTEKVFTYVVRPNGVIDKPRSRVVFHDKERCVVSGRRPTGLAPFASDEPNSAGQLFAHMAYLEAASVLAFAQLERDLAVLGAPEALLRDVRRAGRDEVRHAQQMAALADRHGHAVPQAEAPLQAARGALALALENAVEGCVRELFGALVARFQAERADDLDTRATLSQIADDEATHAALSARLAHWLATRLDEPEARQVAEARADALSSLERELFEPSAAQRAQCGMPSLAESRLLFAQLGPMARALGDLAAGETALHA